MRLVPPTVKLFHMDRVRTTPPLTRSSVCPSRYDTALSPLGQHISAELGLTKRHFFEIPSPHCNLDLEKYQCEDDFE